MAILDFFRKKDDHHINKTISEAASAVSEHLTEICERMRKIEMTQKETSLQLDGIDDFLQNGSCEAGLVDALVALADTIGDFYYFAATDLSSPVFEQAQMMWNTAKKAAMAAELEIIDASNEPFDFRLYAAESTECNINMPNGFVIKTLKCGYIYKGEIVRRAAVIVNKLPVNELTTNKINEDIE